MFMSSTLEAYFFMGRNTQENLRSIKKTGNNRTMKQMFDISEKIDNRTIRRDLWNEYNQLGTANGLCYSV